MNVAFRLDASTIIGTGHLVRCLSLAQALRAAGARCTFLARKLDFDPAPRIAAAGFPVHVLAQPSRPQQFDAHAGWSGVEQARDAEETIACLAPSRWRWVIVDHYSFDATWHDAVRRATGARIGAIDDLGDRPLAVDVLIDHNHCADHAAKYAGRIPAAAAMLTGPRHALLAPDYATAPRYEYREAVRSIGIFMGGVDAHDHSTMALEACRRAGFRGSIETVTTHANPHLPTLRERIAQHANASIKVDLPTLAGFFACHDLQIGGGGGATWERCCIGAPTLAIALAQNQRMVLEPLDRLEVLKPASRVPPTLESLQEDVQTMIEDAPLRRTLAANARLLVDGLGARRVADYLVDHA